MAISSFLTGESESDVLVLLVERGQLDGDAGREGAPGHQEVGVEHLAVLEGGLVRDDLDQGRRHVQAVRDDQVAQVDLVGPVVDGQPPDVKHRQLAGEAQNHVLVLVSPANRSREEIVYSRVLV